MSIALMTLAWKTSLPSGRKIVLLALCDHANDQGECYPSIEAIARKCSMGQRTVQQHLGELEATGILVRRFRSGRSTVYKLDPRNFHTAAASAVARNSTSNGTVSAPRPLHLSEISPAGSTPIIINEPSKDPSPNQQMARGTRLTPDWELPRAWAEWARQQQPAWNAEHVRMVADKFRDYWAALPGLRGVKTDWLATWRNWCRNELALGNNKTTGPDRWWTNDAAMLLKGAELGLTPLPGESTDTYKGRIQRVLDTVGKQGAIRDLPATAARPEELAKITISSANRTAALHAARLLKSRHSDKHLPKH